MISPDSRTVQAALETARPLIVRLDDRRHPEDAAADLIEGWAGVETALRAMVGGSSLGGQALVSDVRAQGRLDYPHAHALLGFLAARDRATRPDYQPTTEDVAAARAGFQAIEAANGLGIAADTAVHRTVGGGGAPPGMMMPTPGVVLPPPTPPADPRRPGAGAGAGPNGPPPVSYARDAGRDGVRDAGRADRRGEPSAPLEREDRGVPTARGLSSGMIVGLALLLLALVAGGAYLALRDRAPSVAGGGRRSSGALDEGITAYRGGRREAARAAFQRAAADQASLSTPRVYLARLAREDGDLPRATAYLDTAIRLDPASGLALREMGQLQLAAGRPQLAVSFFKRAIERNGTDSVANGWMGCALTRLGNTALAENFYGRAGTGEWTACRQAAVPPGGVPVGAGVGPGAVPGAAPAP